MTQPLITIGMTAYNAAGTIERAVDSALLQDWENIEILIYDDASTDETPEIVKTFAERHGKIRALLGNKNRGVAYSRNQLIANAKGVFLAFFDDDDISASSRLSRQYGRITAYEESFANGAPVICHSARVQQYPDGTERIEPTMGMAEEHPAPHGRDVAARILTGRKTPGTFGSLATCAQMARLSTYRDLGGFDETFRRNEDTDFNIRLALAGGHFPGIAAPLVTQTMTLSQEKKLEEELALMLRLLEKHRDFIEQESDYDFCRAWTIAKHDFLRGDKPSFLRKMAALAARHPVETGKRLVRALPNIGFNVRLSRFHDGYE